MSAETSSAGTILVVDDDHYMVRLISYVLETAGYTVVEAANGREALDLLAEHAASLTGDAASLTGDAASLTGDAASLTGDAASLTGDAASLTGDAASLTGDAASLTPDLVICDIMMPELDGFATVEAIRADPKTRGLPVIMLTARGQEQDVQRAQEVGADDYLTKPFSSNQILESVARQLGKSATR